MTEVYISDDGSIYRRLTLDKDEQLIMKYIAKDLQDISKVFSPFSQDFSFAASLQNQRAVNFFGNTSIQRPNTQNKYYCKIYTNCVLNLTGIIQIKEGRYKENKLETYNAKFGTFMTNLKDIIGNDTLTALGSAEIDFKASNIAPAMQYVNILAGVVPVSYFVPFISNNRIWSFEVGDIDLEKDNIAWSEDTGFDSDGFVNERELRPAVSVLSILNLIKAKYNLNIIAPIESRNELKEAYILCNNSVMQNTTFYPFKFGSNDRFQDGPDGKYELTSDVSTNSLKIVLNPSAYNAQNYVKFGFDITNKFSDTHGDSNGRIRVTRKGTDEILYESDFTTQNGKIHFVFMFNDTMFIDNKLEFVINTSFDNLVIHRFAKYRMSYVSNEVLGTFVRTQFVSGTHVHVGYDYDDNTYTTYNKRKIDLIKSLPSTSVLEFLESYLKTFNLKIYDTSPNNDKLFWLTPNDVNTNGLEYSKATRDYTQYLDPKSYPKSALESYNYYNFKHANSGYKSNVDYKAAAGIEYGQTTYPNIIPANPKEYKIETKFSIIPPVFVSGTNSMPTCYGFTADLPTITDDDHFRYTPNYDELTILYKSFPVVSTIGIAVTNCDSIGIATKTRITTYLAGLPFNLNGNSLGFSILVFDNVEYLDSLYKRGYSKEIERLLNPNILQHSFALNLPSTETYLNESTTVQGGGATPSGFRLQNDIIIGETKFSIVDASIDITTGKTNITLLNY